MTTEERLAAVENEVANLRREIQTLRAVGATDIAEVKKVFPRLDAAIKELSEAEIVVSHMQMIQKETLSGHTEWLQEHEKRMAKWNEESAQARAEFDKLAKQNEEAKAEAQRRGRELDERIAKLVSAIGRLIDRKA